MTLLSWFNTPLDFGEDDLILGLGIAGKASYSFPSSSLQVSLPEFIAHKLMLLKKRFNSPLPLSPLYLWALAS